MSFARTSPTSDPAIPTFPVRRFSLDEYHWLIDNGFLTPNDKVELIHGWLVTKMPQNPPHRTCIGRLNAALCALVSGDWSVLPQGPISTKDSEPEPDFALVKSAALDSPTEHPRPKDVALVVEVSDSTLAFDQGEKFRLYAASHIPVYWVVNIPDGRVEVYTQPRRGKNPTYRECAEYGPGDEVPVVVAGGEIGRIPVLTIMPFLAGS